MCYTGQISEYQSADNADSKGQAKEVSVTNKDSIGSWFRTHMHYTQAEKFYTFWPCPETERLSLRKTIIQAEYWCLVLADLQ